MRRVRAVVNGGGGWCALCGSRAEREEGRIGGEAHPEHGGERLGEASSGGDQESGGIDDPER